MKNQLKQQLSEEKLIAIVRGVKVQDCLLVARALYEGGFRFMEITFDQTKPEEWEKTAQTIGEIAKAMEGKMYVGAGTVTSIEQVELTAQYGGAFIISPDTNEEVIGKTLELGLVSIPGAATPTEIIQAHRCGADFVKLFPAGAFGPEYLKAIRAPLKQIEILAVGGIDENNMESFLKAGAAGFGIGSNLVNAKWVEAGDCEKITQIARNMVNVVKGGQENG